MELQLFGLILDFLGTVLLLLFLDPVITNQKIKNYEIPREKIIKRYLMKRYFALIVIIVGFVIQLITLLPR